jgi:hypothetical protein
MERGSGNPGFGRRTRAGFGVVGLIVVSVIVGTVVVAPWLPPAKSASALNLPATGVPTVPVATGFGGSLAVDATIAATAVAASSSSQVTVNGTISCGAPARFDLTVVVEQDVPAAGPTSGRGIVEPMPCDTTPRSWSLAVTGAPLGFADGPATVSVGAVAFTANQSPQFGTQRVEQTVTISGAVPLGPGTMYYLALGDSLATGFAADPGQGYVDLLAAHYRQRFPNLVLVNYGCSGETSSSIFQGSLCSFGGKSQADAAVDFLRAHPGHVVLVTVDIGGNDVVFCGDAGAAADCFDTALVKVDQNVATLMGRLRDAAGPAVRMYGMSYFDPLLNDWLLGPDGQATARDTVAKTDILNQHLVADYAAAGVPSADVAGAFGVDDFTLVSSSLGEQPRNVVNACQWLDIGCVVGGPEGFGDDAIDPGYQVIAAAFEGIIDFDAPPPTPTTTTSTSSTTSTTAPGPTPASPDPTPAPSGASSDVVPVAPTAGDLSATATTTTTSTSPSDATVSAAATVAQPAFTG